MMLNEDFLWTKINRLLDYWTNNGEKSSLGRVFHANQIYETKKGNYNFIIYNLRGFLHGHFLFTVNPDTFQYAIQMHANYGGLTWTTPPTEDRVYVKDDLPYDLQMKVEAYIAYTLWLCLYDKGSGNVVDMDIQILVTGEQWYSDLLNKEEVL